MKEIRIGISGWTYVPWRGDFFPKGLPQRRELEFASRQINSIEINGSFYALQKPASYEKWYQTTPDDFVFSVKANRYITHVQRLKEVEGPLANFFASGVLRLEEKLGPFLWQFPPSFTFDPGKIANFFKLLPRDTEAASDLAGHHAAFLNGKASMAPGTHRPLRHAMEVRHKSFACPEFIDLLRQHDVALVIADTAGKWPFMEDVTSDFVYIRLHGDKKLYESGYTNSAREAWATKIERWREGGNPRDAKRITSPAPVREGGRDVFVYFDNDAKVRAPYDAQALRERVGK
ncbi:MAG: hypothetical protein JWO82_2987, partial [Akkermansiaceae bacterium]|nr:hypothetical protein [Akkermansiaceae bacterium]